MDNKNVNGASNKTYTEEEIERREELAALELLNRYKVFE